MNDTTGRLRPSLLERAAARYGLDIDGPYEVGAPEAPDTQSRAPSDPEIPGGEEAETSPPLRNDDIFKSIGEPDAGDWWHATVPPDVSADVADAAPASEAPHREIETAEWSEVADDVAPSADEASPVADEAPFADEASPVADEASPTGDDATPPGDDFARGVGHRHVAIDRERLADHGMLVPGAAVTSLAEEFRLVKRQLLVNAHRIAQGEVGDDRARMILVSSARPGDGKTFCSINLAMSMAAERDVEILLVDADFPKPGVMHALGLKEGQGLLDALADPAIDVEDCVVATDIAHLSILPVGTRTSSDIELLASAHARRLLHGLAAANPDRIVIFDSPPALAASAASVLAMQVGQVMLVVRADRTGEGELRETVQQLDACANIELLLNAATYASGRPRLGSYYGAGDER